MSTVGRRSKPKPVKQGLGSSTSFTAPRLLIVMILLGVLPGAGASAVAQICDPTSNCDVTDNGGPIMKGPTTVFLVFWLPRGFNYDTSVSNGDKGYENLMERFFKDVSKTSYFDILTQYPGTCGPDVPKKNSCLSEVDVRPLPVDNSPYTQFNSTSQGTANQPLQDSDIQQEVLKMIKQNKITPALDTEFFVFTAAGVQECNGFGCTGSTYCAYHSSTTTSADAPVIYAYMPQDNSLGSGCQAPGVGTSPNNQLVADQEIVIMSHEFFESVSDPFGNTTNRVAWTGPSGEIGDNCNQETGSLLGNGSNVTLNHNAYVVEQIWSNDNEGCVLGFNKAIPGPSIEYNFQTGGDDLGGDSSANSSLEAPGGSAFQSVTLKTESQAGWANNSTHVRVFQLRQTQPAEVSVSLTSHPSGVDSPDNWDIQALILKLRNPNGSLICQESLAGSPLARLTQQAPTNTFPTPHCAPPPPPVFAKEIHITIATGNDDARSDTELWAMLPGELFICLKPSNNAEPDGVCNNGGSATDKNNNQSWNNWTTSAQSFPLPTPQTLDALNTITIQLIEHNSGFEGDDNWDIQGMTVTMTESNGKTTKVLEMSNPPNSNNSNNCMARLKGAPNHSAVTYNLSAKDPGGSNHSNPAFGPTPPGSCPQTTP